MLRPWFPLDEVRSGLFEIAERLFGLSVRQVDNPVVWHPDVGYFEVRDEAGVHLGSFYTDWFPRETKRQGAWMDGLVAGGPTRDGGFNPHLAFIGGNFNPPHRHPSRPAHPPRGLHPLPRVRPPPSPHRLPRRDSRARRGSTSARDWVEVPSQIMENWCWEREALDLFARHHETGEPLPDAMLGRLLAARRFMGGWLQMRQLSFANLDLELHRTWRGDIPVMDYAADALRPFVPSDRFVERHILPLLRPPLLGRLRVGLLFLHLVRDPGGGRLLALRGGGGAEPGHRPRPSGIMCSRRGTGAIRKSCSATSWGGNRIRGRSYGGTWGIWPRRRPPARSPRNRRANPEVPSWLL